MFPKKSRIIVPVLLILVSALVITSVIKNYSTRSRIPYSRINIPNARGPVSNITFYPAEIQDVLNNPYMGWVPWANGGPYQQPHKMVHAGVTWRELEPAKGVYDFSAFEAKNKFSYWESRDIKINIRLNMDYPGSTSHKDIPDWLYNEINGNGTWYSLDFGKGFSPNYSNPKLIWYHKLLIDTMAKRYNNDPRIANIELGSIGHWGEWHTRKDSTITIPFPNTSVSDQYVRHYLNAFTDKKLLMRRPFLIARDNGMGLFNDSFGNAKQTNDYFINWFKNGYVDYLTGESQPAMPDFWKNAPSGGEVGDYPGLVYFQNDRLNATLQQISDSHTSWLGPSCPALQPAGTNLQANFNTVLKKMGYRFVLQSATHVNQCYAGTAMPVTMNWINRGVAPFYYRWPLELSLVDSNNNIVAATSTPEDIRTWLPGIKTTALQMNVPSNLASGRYTLCVAILNPKTNKPGIDLAIGNRRPDGRYALDTVSVLFPSTQLPSPWVLNNVGSPEIPGSVSYSNNVYTLNGAGNDIWSTSDQFTFVSRGITGDSSISARIVSQTNTDGWAKAGIMFRETVNPDSRYVNLFISPSNGLVLQWRDNTGGSCGSKSLGNVTLPAYIRLVRTGNTFSAYKSTDGTNWGTSPGYHNTAMNTNIQTGLSVTSHNPVVASRVVYDSVRTMP